MNLENSKAKRWVELCVRSCSCSFVNPRIIYTQHSLSQENFTYFIPQHRNCTLIKVTALFRGR